MTNRNLPECETPRTDAAAETGRFDILADCSRQLERELRQARGRWIPVSERLPDEDKHVQLLHRDGTQWVGYLSTERPIYEEDFKPFNYFIDRAENEHWEWEDITHWMSLPTPPASGEK